MIDYQIVRRHTSRISLRVMPDGTARVTAPHLVPKFLIDQYISKHQDWIEGRRAKIADKPSYITTHTVYLWGIPYTVELSDRDHIDHDQHVIETQIQSVSHLRSQINSEFISHLTDQVNHYTQALEVEYQKLRIKQVTSIWGSCTRDNKLTFSSTLIHLPKDLVDYVIVHEVCHIVVKNHSSSFWDLVSRHDPLYKSHRARLRQISRGVSLV
jgi:predicted metal-dependent hydrolase